MERLKSLALSGKVNQNASVRDGQSVLVNAPIDAVWALIADPTQWPRQSSHIKNIKSSDILVDCPFEWRVDGKLFHASFQLVDPPKLLSWISQSGFIKTIHVLSLERVSERQTVVTIDQSLQGPILPLGGNHTQMNHQILDWLAGIQQMVNAGY